MYTAVVVVVAGVVGGRQRGGGGLVGVVRGLLETSLDYMYVLSQNVHRYCAALAEAQERAPFFFS